MNKTSNQSKWNFGKKMESMDDAALKQRIQDAYNYEMPPLRPVPYIGEKGIVITYDYTELTGRCPVTGIQDLYRIVIDFVPDQTIPELKTLKIYYQAYEALPISHEHLCSKIFKEFNTQVKPQKLYVRLLTAVRGGVYSTIALGDTSISTSLNMRHVGI